MIEALIWGILVMWLILRYRTYQKFKREEK